MNYKRISVIANLIGILAVAIVFFKNIEKVELLDWYLTIIPVFISYSVQFLALLSEEL